MLEILAPAGNAECAKAAINNGANAIYLGYSSFSARQSAENFDEASLRSIILNAHACGVQVYVAMNTLVKDQETEDFIKTLLLVWAIGADAIILQDVFLGKAIHEQYPEIVLHLSTQAGVCNLCGAKFAKECGFSRVILARETPIAEIAEIAKFIETEVFVQGALCTCFSGQCYFSSFAGGNSGNRGRCKQPCRKLYSYDRVGFEDKTYALSLSDLSVGEDIQKLIEAGVVSFKIEGRMRRAEYVAAAVRYYRILLDKIGNPQAALSDLKRTYNRGNYTKGLAFGQDKRFLSVLVQGHIGEKVGVVKVQNGKFFVESIFKPMKNDAFKILRNGKEVGGATFEKCEGRGFFITSKVRLLNGDGVFITTDNAVNERVLKSENKRKLSIRLRFTEGEKAYAESGKISLYSEDILSKADNRALTVEELKECFLKTDGLPFDVEFENIDLQGNIFIPKSKLNAFRRDFYNAVTQSITQNGHTTYEFKTFSTVRKTTIDKAKTAIISSDFSEVQTDIAILKLNAYTQNIDDSFKNGAFEKYLYYPAFCTHEDINRFKKLLQETNFDGIYAENYGGIVFARENNLKVFAGTGFNLLNGISVQQLLRIPEISYYAISKEANGNEAKALLNEKAFVLSSGDIKLMDLIYCPFGKTCAKCDKKSLYMLTDENGRTFPVRRYTAADNTCRFEVYNCASLVGKGIDSANMLLDVSVTSDKKSVIESKNDEEEQKRIFKTYTSGHFKRGVL